VIVRERLKLVESVVVDRAAILTNAAQQSTSCSAEGSVSPARVLFPGLVLLPLENPLEWVIHHPPILVELGYEAI